MTKLGTEGLPLLPKGRVTMVKATPAYAVKNVDLVRIVMLKSNRADRTVRALPPETCGSAKLSYARMLGRRKPPTRWITASLLHENVTGKSPDCPPAVWHVR